MRSRVAVLTAGTLVLSTPLSIPASAQTAPQAKPATVKVTGTTTSTNRFAQVNLVSDVPGKAPVTDPKLVNPWGLAMGKTLWVSGAGTGVATVYSGNAKKEQTEVAIPGGTPTGQVVNTSQDEFLIKDKPATFIFASPSGAITAWNAEVNPKNAVIAAFTKNADYKGLAVMNTNRGAFLLAPSFSHGKIHVYDSEFDRVRLSRSQFRDPRMPGDYAPFNVEVVGNVIMVAYAKRDAVTGKAVPGRGNGFVSRFSANGRFLGRFANRGALNAPWAMIRAPRGFGALAGAVLVGNFGDGLVNAYNARTGRYLGPLRQTNGQAIQLEGLWDLEPGTATNGGENSVWFAAGIDKAQHGLLGVLRPSDAGPLPGAASTPAPSVSAPATPKPSAATTPTSSAGGMYGY
ncbi:TIGR03118 family protein [Herbidospora yilanensis]|uniref:TIGR03118 family protein n=1 Tax=Herbidospora yilanensis TaxID=354426 RepID=UPI000781BA02|nr:TIGR03118 family protein [Herbidospora yilanensis]